LYLPANLDKRSCRQTDHTITGSASAFPGYHLKGIARPFARCLLRFFSGLSPGTFFSEPVPNFASVPTIMHESFTLWFPSGWTLVGAFFTIFSFSLAVFLAFGRRDSITPLLHEIMAVLQTIRDQSASLWVVQGDVAALTKAVTAPGQSCAKTLRTLCELRTDFQALASEAREACEAVTRLTTDPQAPATPVLLKILAKLRKMTKGDPWIQKGLWPFSLQVFLEAQAKVLARERIQATPNPFLDLD
jgi:hypothetical protein